MEATERSFVATDARLGKSHREVDGITRKAVLVDEFVVPSKRHIICVLEKIGVTSYEPKCQALRARLLVKFLLKPNEASVPPVSSKFGTG